MFPDTAETALQLRQRILIAKNRLHSWMIRITFVVCDTPEQVAYYHTLGPKLGASLIESLAGLKH